MRRWPAKSRYDLPHIPVLAERVVEHLRGCPPGYFVDATIGAGGHLQAVHREFRDRFKYIGFDLDGEAIENSRKLLYREGIKAQLVQGNFTEIVGYITREGKLPISAVLYDLGISSTQIDNPERGFSYLHDGPLRLVFDPKQTRTAADLIRECDEAALFRILREYGQEPKAKSIARAIKAEGRSISTTRELAAIIRRIAGPRLFVKTAARVFQALRIKVNEELANLELGLQTLIPLVQNGGRVLVISYHSLEDKIVKIVFRKYSGKCVCPPRTMECRCGKKNIVRILTVKPERPSPEEVAHNPRARSAKLRVAEKIAA